jgi:murein DD-endopeptidase MepM/ murein hydrolase activator NlpD
VTTLNRRLSTLAPMFLAGAITGSILTWSYFNAPAQLEARLADDCGDPSDAPDVTLGVRPARTPDVVIDRPARTVERIGPDMVVDLRERALTLPVRGIDPKDLRDSFEEDRSGGRRHEAIDILAPRNTPVLAVEDGVVAKLFTSKAGGLTIYQFDPTTTYAYYYAHLEKYAAGLTDKMPVKRGQVIGYVGTSGNAPPNTPHLHFAIFRLTDKKQWWQGTAIDPFGVLR